MSNQFTLTPMIDPEFCAYLEYEITKAFRHSANHQIKDFWCDGVIKDQADNAYSQKTVNDTRKIVLKAFIGKDGQTEFELVLKLGNKALSRYARNLDIRECLPGPDNPEFMMVDVGRKRIEIRLY